MNKHIIIPLLLALAAAPGFDKKNDRITSSDTLNITIDAPSEALAPGARIPMKANCTNAQSNEADVSPAWSVENSLGTFEPTQGKSTTFIAGSVDGVGKVYATCNGVRGETTVTVGCPSNGDNGGTGGGGGGGGGGGCDYRGSDFFGLFSEKFQLPGILLDTDSSRFANGGCIGVWPDGNKTQLSEGVASGEISEGVKSIKCTVGGSGGGWWLQFGSDDMPGLSTTDVMKAKDMGAFAGGYLKFDVRSPKDVLIELQWGNGNPQPHAYYTLRELGIPRDNKWHSVSIPLDRFARIDYRKIKMPASFSSAPGCVNFTFYIDNVRWEK